MPKWALGLQTAQMVLEKSDPGYRYHHPQNVQCTKARIHIGGWIAQSSIFSAVTRELDSTVSKKQFKWLVEGGSRDVRRVGAHMGMAPMLLHRLAQITHICAKFAEVGDQIAYRVTPNC
jgi:hypothetical protein